MVPISSFPVQVAERDRWILAHRPERNVLDARRPYAFFVEEECTASREVVPVATVFLTNRECPWRCLMCDLWRNTLTDTVPAGAIPEQIDFALSQLAQARQIKLYNSGSFFDNKAIPGQDYSAIADRIRSFERTIVECHPALIGRSCLEFRDLLPNQLEVAMGLETVHPEVLEQLNKRMTLDQFAAAADFLRRSEIDLRAFILVQPPFMPPTEALYWAQRSLGFAFDCGATAATLIPTRSGNGAMESLAQSGDFAPPLLETVEAAAEYGLELGRGRVFVDLWGVHAGQNECSVCHKRRIARLREMNLTQQVQARVLCASWESHN
jgi:archaeosine synthase beta-subunit